jgi:hypothetical protein
MQLSALSLALTRSVSYEGEAPPPPALALADLTDVQLTEPQNGDELTFTDGFWRNEQ